MAPNYHDIKHKWIHLYVFFSVDERGQTLYLAALTPVSILQDEPVWTPHSDRTKLWWIESSNVLLSIETWSQDVAQTFFVSESSRISLRNMRAITLKCTPNSNKSSFCWWRYSRLGITDMPPCHVRQIVSSEGTRGFVLRNFPLAR
jgi:hypothetical protein